MKEKTGIDRRTFIAGAASFAASATFGMMARELDALGRLTVSAENPRYFEADGKPFVPIGVNLCYCRDREPQEGYLRWLDRFAANGGNYIRIWCGDALWDVMPRFGEIDPAVVNRLQWLADACAKRRIRIKFTLEQFRGFDDSQPPVFRKSIYAPYARTVRDWFTRDACQTAFRRKIDALAEAVADPPATAVVEI